VSATTEHIAERLQALAEVHFTEDAKQLRAAAALIRTQSEALRAAKAALAAYEVAHDQDQGAWSLGGLHDAEALSVDAQVKIDAALKGDAWA